MSNIKQYPSSWEISFNKYFIEQKKVLTKIIRTIKIPTYKHPVKLVLKVNLVLKSKFLSEW